MAKPWGGAGAWAAEAEQAEAEAKAAGNTSSSNSGGLKNDAFPSLGDTMASTKGPKKKNKPQTFSISEFTVGAYVGPGGKNRERPMSNTRGLSADEMMLLPTGPRDRSNEEPDAYGGLGGGFKDYGGFRGGGDRMGMDRGDRFGGGFDREGRGDRMGRDRDGDYRDDGPSRADEAVSWGANKKAPSQLALRGSGPEDRMGRGGGGGYEENNRDRGRISDRDLPSRADEADTWGKKSVPSPQPSGSGDSFDRRSGRGGGFEDVGRRSGGFDDGPGQISRADGADNWSAGKRFLPSAAPERRGGFESSYRDVGSEAERWSRRELPPRSEDAPRPAERQRLVLQPRTVPVDSPVAPPLPVDRNGENERPHSSHSTRSDRGASGDLESLDTADQQPPPKPRPRSNPFGSARPREEVLAEKGQDWRKLDAELETKRPSSSHSNRSSRPQTPETEPGEAQRSRPKSNPFGDAKPRDTGREERVDKEESLDSRAEEAAERPLDVPAVEVEGGEDEAGINEADKSDEKYQAQEKSTEESVVS